MRFTITLAAAALALTATAVSADTGEQSFRHDGKTYVYTTKAENGRTIISGRQMPSGEDFRLVVAGGRVTGTAGGSAVTFRTSTARGAAGGVQIAAN